MQIIKHRVNSSKDLREIDNSFGIELDIRSMIKGGAIGAGVMFVGGLLIWLSSRAETRATN